MDRRQRTTTAVHQSLVPLKNCSLLTGKGKRDQIKWFCMQKGWTTWLSMRSWHLMVRFLRGLEDNYIVSEDRKTSLTRGRQAGIITAVCQFYSPRPFNHRVVMCDCLLGKAIIMTKCLLHVSGSVRLRCTFTHWKLIWWTDKKVAPGQSGWTFIQARVTYKNNVIRTLHIFPCGLYAVMSITTGEQPDLQNTGCYSSTFL